MRSLRLLVQRITLKGVVILVVASLTWEVTIHFAYKELQKKSR